MRQIVAFQVTDCLIIQKIHCDKKSLQLPSVLPMRSKCYVIFIKAAAF